MKGEKHGIWDFAEGELCGEPMRSATNSLSRASDLSVT